MRVIQNIFTAAEIQALRETYEVAEAYGKLKTKKSVYFSIPLARSLKEKLSDAFGLDLIALKSIPFRWMRGDTPAHIDRGSSSFENTYLVYLTDSDGTFHIEEESYPIQEGTGFVFSEGLSHEVVGTNGTARLLLGPMSESGFPVGAGGIVADGATDTVYIKQEDLSYYFQINDQGWNGIPSFPCTLFNTNATPETNILKVIFTTAITFTEVNHYFVIYSNGIQIGNKSLDSNGGKQYITIDGTANYPGLIRNGTSGSSGYSHIYIYNISISEIGAFLFDYSGWLGQQYFGNGAAENYIVNCSSSGDIPAYGGGIVGAAAGGQTGGSLVLRGCSSYGSIGTGAGAIVGTGGGSTGGSVTCEQCWSEGIIQGQDAGGIFGSYAGNNSGYALALKCYSTGVIANDAGGIFGGYAGESTGVAYAQKCYSMGTSQGNGGGIFSRYAAYLFGATNATNCYSSGSLTVSGYGIYGINQQVGATQASCYVANNSWSDSAANAALDGDPGTSPVGNTWVRIQANTPYELNGFGATPYTTQVIDSSSQLIQNYSQTIAAGESSIEALQADASGNAFAILQTSGGDAGSYSTITISAQRGAISTTADTVPGTYVFVVRSIGSYFITTFTLTVSSPEGPGGTTTVACCVSEMNERGLSYEWINDYRIGNRLIAEHLQNPNLKFNGYSEYIKYKMAQGARKV